MSPRDPACAGHDGLKDWRQEVADLSVTGLAARGSEIGIVHIARPSITGALFEDDVLSDTTSSVWDLPGSVLAGNLTQVMGTMLSGFFANLLALIVASFVNLAVGVFVFFMFIRIAIWLLVAMLEFYIAIVAGVFFTGMLAFRGTAPMFTGYLRYLVYVSVKLFFLILIAGAALSIGTALSEMIASGQVPDAINIGAGNATGIGRVGKARLGFSLAVAAIAFLLHSLAKVLPERIAKQVAGALSLDMRRLLSR